MTLTIHNLTLSPDVAAEVLALAPDVPADMLDEAVTAAICCVLDAHHDDLRACWSDLMQAWGDHPMETAARMARATVHTSRLMAVAP